MSNNDYFHCIPLEFFTAIPSPDIFSGIFKRMFKHLSRAKPFILAFVHKLKQDKSFLHQVNQHICLCPPREFFLSDTWNLSTYEQGLYLFYTLLKK